MFQRLFSQQHVDNYLGGNYTGFHGICNSKKNLQDDVMLVKLYGSSDQPVLGLHNPNLNLVMGRRSCSGGIVIQWRGRSWWLWGGVIPILLTESRQLPW